MIVEVCDRLDTDELVVAAEAWPPFRRALHCLVSTRNLQCFTLKKGTREVNIGVGVQVEGRGRFLSCEFDWVSDVAFQLFGARRSIQGLEFTHWLPLALNERHWTRIKASLLPTALGELQRATHGCGPIINVVHAFMNDVVVKLSNNARHGSRSTLIHASEKAVASYFALFQLLVCMCVEDPSIMVSAHQMVDDFVDGKHHKNEVPNLGHFVIARLLSDVDRGVSSRNECAFAEV